MSACIINVTFASRARNSPVQRFSEPASVLKKSYVRAYAFEPYNPCSSPANATSSTFVWNLMPSSLIRRAIASKEMVPEPSSLPPGAYNSSIMSTRRSPITTSTYELTRDEPKEPRES